MKKLNVLLLTGLLTILSASHVQAQSKDLPWTNG